LHSAVSQEPSPEDVRRYAILVEGAAGSFACADDTAVLIAMEKSGKKAIAVGCRGGGCGFCRVQVRSGAYRTLRMSRAHVTEEEERQGYALACRLLPLGDLTLLPARRNR
jgi:ferredoxin